MSIKATVTAMGLLHSSSRLLSKLRNNAQKGVAWSRTHIPPGVRTVLGLLLIVGGVLGFLPILGFWMIPLGFAILALDFVSLWRFLRARFAIAIDRKSEKDQDQ